MIWHSAAVNEVLTELKTDSEIGLLNGVADQRLKEHGENVISNTKKPSLLKIFLNTFKSKTLIALLCVCLLSFIVSLIYYTIFIPININNKHKQLL